MKRIWRALSILLRLVPTALLMWLTLDSLARYDNNWFVLGPMWFLLIAWWVGRTLYDLGNKQLSARALVLPICAAFTWTCWWTNLPFRVLWHIQKPVLQAALSRPEQSWSESSNAARIGFFRPIQINKRGNATEFLLWKHSQGFIGEEAVGFAYCPGDQNCIVTNFRQSPATVLHRMGDDWYLVKEYIPD